MPRTGAIWGISVHNQSTHRGLDRRVLMVRLGELAGGTAAAASALAALCADPVRAAIVPPDDPRFAADRVTTGMPDADTVVNIGAIPLAAHERLMRRAIAQGRRNPAFPFGAVIVRAADLAVVARGVNDSRANPILHGEVAAMNDYVRRHGNRGWGRMVLYTTAEPCPMCQSALIWAGIGGVVYGTSIATLKLLGIGQIDIPAKAVAAAAPFWNGGLLGGVLAAETDRLFAGRERG